jgi:hypothetical protein
VEASTEAFHLAMLVMAAVLGAGALINAVGIRNPREAIVPKRPPECLPGSTPA